MSGLQGQPKRETLPTKRKQREQEKRSEEMWIWKKPGAKPGRVSLLRIKGWGGWGNLRYTLRVAKEREKKHPCLGRLHDLGEQKFREEKPFQWLEHFQAKKFKGTYHRPRGSSTLKDFHLLDGESYCYHALQKNVTGVKRGKKRDKIHQNKRKDNRRWGGGGKEDVWCCQKKGGEYKGFNKAKLRSRGTPRKATTSNLLYMTRAKRRKVWWSLGRGGNKEPPRR